MLEVTRYTPNEVSYRDRETGRCGSVRCNSAADADAAEARLRAGTYQFAGEPAAPVGNYVPPILPLPTLNFEPKLQQPGHGQMPTAALPPEAPPPNYAGAGFPAQNYTPEVLLPPTMNFTPPAPKKIRGGKDAPAPEANLAHDPNLLPLPQMFFGTKR
jgi:hypothetical protein